MTSPQQQQMAAIVADLDKMRAEVAELRRMTGTLIKMLGEHIEANGKPAKPALRVVPDVTP